MTATASDLPRKLDCLVALDEVLLGAPLAECCVHAFVEFKAFIFRDRWAVHRQVQPDLDDLRRGLTSRNDLFHKRRTSRSMPTRTCDVGEVPQSPTVQLQILIHRPQHPPQPPIMPRLARCAVWRDGDDNQLSGSANTWWIGSRLAERRSERGGRNCRGASFVAIFLVELIRKPGPVNVVAEGFIVQADAHCAAT